MANKNEERYIKINVPQEAIFETAEIIENSDLEATILGTNEDNLISIGINYSIKERENVMEILELLEDFDDDEEDDDE